MSQNSNISNHNNHYNRPFRARVRTGGLDIFLGYYKTREEAKQVQEEFKRANNIDNSPQAVAIRAAQTQRNLYGRNIGGARIKSSS